MLAYYQEITIWDYCRCGGILCGVAWINGKGPVRICSVCNAYYPQTIITSDHTEEDEPTIESGI